MSFNRTVALLLLMGVSTLLRAEAVSPDEVKKQNEFKQAYSTPERGDRVKALEMLKGLTHLSTAEILATVASVDQYKEVRVEAFKMLSQIPARDPSLAHAMVSAFQATKISDIEVRLEFMPFMKNSEFKYEILDTLVDFGSKLRYPDLITAAYTGGMGFTGDPNVMTKKQRAQFVEFLKVFNTIASSDVKEATDKNTPLQVKKWWEPHRAKVLAADRELNDKYRAEDRAVADKNNPLVPKKAN